jgi:hypothetical protein
MGALEDDEHRHVEAELHRDPALRAELARLRQCLEPLEEAWQPVCAPPGLWQRTCRFVDVAGRALPGGLMRPSRWSLRDLAAAAAVLIIGTLLLFPTLSQSRFQAAVVGCQNNLRELGISLKHFADSHNGHFPEVPRTGNDAFAGVYAAVLRDNGLLTDANYTICPAVASQRQESIRIPSCVELRSATMPQLAELRRVMNGDYGYHLPCVVNGRYMAVRDQNRNTFAIMADAPSPSLDGLPSGNHGASVQNVLLENCSVRSFRADDLSTIYLILGDYPFLNEDQEVAPGKHAQDAVVAPANARPVKWDR